MYVRIDGIKLVKSMQYVSFSKQLIKTVIVSNGVCITIMSQNILTQNLQSALLFALVAITTGKKSIGYVVCHSSLGVQRLGVS